MKAPYMILLLSSTWILLIPQVTWGTSPGMGTDITSTVPVPAELPTENERKAAEKALEYMGLTPGTPMSEIEIDYVFIGSCTNGRIEDLRAAAEIARGYKVATELRLSSFQAPDALRFKLRKKGLDQIFTEAGFEWRDAGCSHVSGDEPGRTEAWTTLRIDFEP